MTSPLELWGGPECTVNRIGDVWRDQTRLTGHHDRIEDLDRFAALGVKALRYPILWERTETAPGQFDWTWPDARMARMETLGLRPIVGLLHHGSGPAWTDLLDPAFPAGVARHAAEVARRYPHVRDWTPVNEPLTTARFSCLYGHWHPHRRDERDFWLALLNQIEATRLSMTAIRAVNPHARLIQTEDFGQAGGTDACASQVRFENDRRFMTWDLLCGRVVAGHPLFDRLAGLGFGDRLASLAEAPCAPDVIGLNHYITSDRFLDHRLDRYPPHTHGHNGEMAYADVEAIRALEHSPIGWGRDLATLQARYGRPLAVTECHIGSTPAQQIAWLHDCWRDVLTQRDAGASIEAVTVWSLLGAVDWDSLLTQSNGRYESGAYDVSSGEPDPTDLAHAIRNLAATAMAPDHGPAEEAWWMRADRRVFFPEEREETFATGEMAPGKAA